MSKTIRGLALGLCLLSKGAAAQLSIPELLTKVEPEYPPSMTSWLTDPLQVSITVDSFGNVSALESRTGLPDAVVRALAKWKFRPGTSDGRPTQFVVRVEVPVRRPVNQYLNSSTRPSTEVLLAYDKAVPADQLNPEKARAIESRLKDGLSSVTQRAELIRYAASGSDPDGEARRGRPVIWMIRNAPMHSAMMTPEARTAVQDAEAKRLWLELLKQKPRDASLIGHATWFLQPSDPAAAEEILRDAADHVGGAAAWLGELYGAQHPDPQFAAHAREMLVNTRDGRVLLGALSAAAHNPETCRMLLDRVKTFDSANAATCDGASSEGVVAAGAAVQQGKLIRNEPPLYPPEARARRISGTALFTALIGKDGKVADLQFLSGPLVFFEGSRATLLKWVYNPTLLNGQPVEVITNLNINYTLN